MKKALYLISCFMVAIGLFGCNKSDGMPVKNSAPGVDFLEEVDVPEKDVCNSELMQCMTDENGIRMKVIAKYPDVVCYETPGGVSNGRDLHYFHQYFVFDLISHEGQVYYLIGSSPRKRDLMGYVKGGSANPDEGGNSDVELWSTRMGARYTCFNPDGTPRSDLPILSVFGSDQELESSLRGERIKPLSECSFGNIPEGEDAFAKEQALMPWPIIDHKVVEIGGEKVRIAKIAFLGDFSEGADLTTGEGVVDRDDVQNIQIENVQIKETREKVEREVKKLDVVFVMDTTGSMSSSIRKAKAWVAKTAENFSNMSFKPDLALGFVEYRDWDSGFGPDKKKATKIHQLTNLTRFIKSINSVQAGGGGDTPEAVFDGLMDAIHKIKWRGGGLSERIIILVGDFPSHVVGDKRNPRKLTADKVANDANQNDKHITIFSVKVNAASDDGKSEHKQRLDRQFSTLARVTGGKFQVLGNASQFIPYVEEIFDTGVATTKERHVFLEKIGENKSKDDMVAEIGEESYTRVLTFLNTAGIDVSRLKPGQPAYSTGWVCLETKSSQSLTVETYMARSELSSLIIHLQGLLGCLQNPNSAEKLFKTGIMLRTEGMISGNRPDYFKADTQDTMDVYLAVEGVPVGKHSILNFRKSEIKHMTEERRLMLFNRISTYHIKHLNDFQGNVNAFVLGRDQTFIWVPEIYLP